MPTYVYKRKDGSTFEIEQKISEPALETCPSTGQPVTRVITGGTGLIFKGSGFYLTDYARNGSGSKEKSAKANDDKSSDKASKAEATSDKSSDSPKAASK